MKKRNANLYLSTLLLLTLTILSGCSLFGGGKKKGDADGLKEGDLRTSSLDGGQIPSASEGGMFRDVNFDYDSSSISDSARQNIEYNAEVLRSNRDVRVQLEGHTDERGTNEYNMTLGSARAKAVRDVLVSLGIPSSRLDTISYGEDIPLDTGHSESAWSRNRRVHTSVFGGGGGSGAGTLGSSRSSKTY